MSLKSDVESINVVTRIRLLTAINSRIVFLGYPLLVLKPGESDALELIRAAAQLMARGDSLDHAVDKLVDITTLTRDGSPQLIFNI